MGPPVLALAPHDTGGLNRLAAEPGLHPPSPPPACRQGQHAGRLLMLRTLRSARAWFLPCGVEVGSWANMENRRALVLLGTCRHACRSVASQVGNMLQHLAACKCMPQGTGLFGGQGKPVIQAGPITCQ